MSPPKKLSRCLLLKQRFLKICCAASHLKAHHSAGFQSTEAPKASASDRQGAFFWIQLHSDTGMEKACSKTLPFFRFFPFFAA